MLDRDNLSLEEMDLAEPVLTGFEADDPVLAGFEADLRLFSSFFATIGFVLFEFVSFDFWSEFIFLEVLLFVADLGFIDSSLGVTFISDFLISGDFPTFSIFVTFSIFATFLAGENAESSSALRLLSLEVVVLRSGDSDLISEDSVKTGLLWMELASIPSISSSKYFLETK